jgi:hypothetical protein
LEIQKTSIRDPLTNETTSFNVIWGLKKRVVPLTHDKNMTLSAAANDDSVGADRDCPVVEVINPHPVIRSPQDILSFLQSWGIPVPRNVIVESVDDSVGNYTNREFWLDVNLRHLEKQAQVICIGTDIWTVLE